MILTNIEVNVVEKGFVKIYCGEGKEVFMIQFLKGRYTGTLDYLKRLEPEVKVFRFEKMSRFYEELSEDEQREEELNIRNGVNFARKVVSIGECDVLILDEFLGLVDLGIIAVEDVIQIIRHKPEEMELILTGRNLPEALVDEADYISKIGIVKKADEEM